jgi:hypothetical protein
MKLVYWKELKILSPYCHSPAAAIQQQHNNTTTTATMIRVVLFFLGSSVTGGNWSFMISTPVLKK